MMRKLLTFLTTLIAAVAVILLFTACQQFLDNPEDFLSYWASEAFIKDHSIGEVARPDGAGVPCVSSSVDVHIMLTVHNPKNFSLVMPTASESAGIVEFKELSEQPAAGTHYELKQVDSGTLKLTYKKGFLEKYEQGLRSLNPTITLKAKDGRVFKKNYTFGIKSNTPPPKPTEIIIAKTKMPPSNYVLCLKFDPDEMNRTAGTVPVHKDIISITINDTPYTLSYKGINLGFQEPAETPPIGSFITRNFVAKLTEDIPQAQDKWVLYFKTEVPVESANEQISYTITLSDNKGVVSDSVTQDLEKKFKVEFDANDGNYTPDTQYIRYKGKVTEPSPPPTKAGHTLDGWYKDGGQKWNFTSDKVTNNMKLYAKWMKAPDAPYRVEHYQQNIDDTYPDTAQDTDTGLTGTTGEMLSVGHGITLRNYPGFKFHKLEPASPTIAADGNTVVKVYYQRKEIRVTFKPNGGKIDGNTSDVTKTGKYGTPLIAPANLDRKGYTFSNWQPTSPAPSLPSTFPAEDATYTAQWTPITYYVRFNGNGNNGGNMNNQTFTYGTAQLLSANGFTKKGHTFDGWATSASGSKVYYNQQSVINLTDVQNGTVNLYAVWKIETYTVRFSVANGKGTLKGEYSGQNEIAQNGGGIKTLTNIPYGSTVSFKATADEGWEVESWKVSSGNFASAGGIGAAIATATLTVDGDKTVTVKFKPGELHLSGGSGAWEKLKEEAAKTEGAHTILIDGGITATSGNDAGEILLGRDLIIKPKNSSAYLDANGKSQVFDVKNGKTLILEDITIKNGQAQDGKPGGGAAVWGRCTLIMKGSSAITNCSAHKGGGVYVNNGTLIMQDSSTISSCTATDKGSGVYVAGTFEMKGNARVNTNNDVYLESGKSITVTGSLSHHPAARITPNSYTNGRVLATGAAEKANFTVTPQDGNKYWRFKKQGGEVKFVPAKLKVTFNKIKCVEVKDASSEAEYYWTMKVGKYVIAERPSNSVWDAKKGHIYEFIENGEYNKYFNWDFSYFPISEIPDINTTPKNYIPVYINIMEYDKSDPDDHIGTTKAHLTYDYDNDQWKWEYDGSQSHGNQESNPHITIGDGGEEIFTEEYRTNDGDTDVTITISWKE